MSTMQMNEFFYGGNEKPHWGEIDNYQGPYDRRSSERTLPVYEFRVPMCCSKCEEKVREELSELDGVYEVFADQLSERAAVTGFVDPVQALKKMKRIKKKSEFWGGSSPIAKSNHSHSHHKKSSQKQDYPSSSRSSHETVYRSAPSQVAFNRASSSQKKKHFSFDDEVSYSDLRARNSRGPSSRSNYASYDDGVSYGKSYATHDDGVSDHRKSYGSYCDDGFSYRNRYDDGVTPSSTMLSRDVPRSRSLRYDAVPRYAENYYIEEQYPAEYPMFNHY